MSLRLALCGRMLGAVAHRSLFRSTRFRHRLAFILLRRIRTGYHDSVTGYLKYRSSPTLPHEFEARPFFVRREDKQLVVRLHVAAD